jgi:hypothetical protein
MLHIRNIEYLLTHGICSRSHKMADPNYINIGDSTLIGQRQEFPIGITPPGGVLGEYVPFYFGVLSPMLLNIKTGYRGIQKRPQDEIVYVVCRVNDVVERCMEWCFTDGHAKNNITAFYNDLNKLDAVDWDLVNERYWRNTEEDIDRMRRKQAEFLVRHHVPVSCICGVVVHDLHVKQAVDALLNRLSLKIPVLVSPMGKYYY